MQEIFRKILGVYSGEAAQAFRFARLIMLWAFGSACLDILSDGLFLEKLGASSFPKAYFGTSTVMIAVSSLVLWGLKVSNPYRILMITLGFGSLVLFSSAIFIESAVPLPFWYGLKIASKMFFLMVIPISWTFTDQYHDLQDAKRVYAIYNAAYSIGTILAGAGINLLLDRIGFSSFLVLGGISVILAMLDAKRITRKTKALHDDNTEGIFSSGKDSFKSVCKHLLSSRFVIILLLLGLFNQLMNTVTEFNYMQGFGSAFASIDTPPEEGRIAEFIGKCRAFISFANILIGMFFYNRCLRRIGLTNTLLITPLVFVMVYSGWVFQGGLLFSVLGLTAIEGFLYTFDDNCSNLLSGAVPSKLKSKVRVISGSFFEPVGMLLSSILLFSFHKNSIWLGLALAIFVFGLALTIRSIYPSALLSNLRENALHFERKLKDWIKTMNRREQKESKKAIISALKSSQVDMQVLGAKALLEMDEKGSLDLILSHVKKFTPPAKIKLLHLLEISPFSKEPKLIEMISSWGDESHSFELSKHANFYLAKKGMHHPEKVEEDLDQNDLFLRSTAILTLKRSFKTPLFALNRTIAMKKLDLMLSSDSVDEVVMGLEILSRENSVESAERAIPFLDEESTLIQRASAKCISRQIDKTLTRHSPLFLETLETTQDHILRVHLIDILKELSDTTTIKDLLLASIHFRPSERRKVEEAILEMGLKTVPLLITLTKDASLPERARILAGKILGRKALPQLRANLPDILDIEIDRAYFYFYFAHTIQKQYPLFDLQMLQNALLSGYQSVIDFIIHLLGAAGSLEDPELLVRSLHSRNAKVHSHAVESLERTCDAKTFRLIAPLVDDLPLEEKMNACLSWHGDFPKLTLSELLDKLDDSPLLFDKLASIHLKTKLKMPNWREELRESLKHADETIHQYAYELLET